MGKKQPYQPKTSLKEMAEKIIEANTRHAASRGAGKGGGVYIPPTYIYKSVFNLVGGLGAATVNFGPTKFYGQSSSTKWMLLTNDTWLGTPPGIWGNDGEYDQTIPTVGNPAWWTTLNGLGLKANGLAVYLEYPGGFEAYRDAIIKPNAKKYLAAQFLGSARCTELGWDQVSAIPQTVLNACKEFRGYVILDDEYNWPTSNPYWSVNAALGYGHIAYRAVLDRVLGYTASDAEYSASYESVFHAHVEAIQTEARELFVNMAGFGRYGYPFDGPHAMYANQELIDQVVASHNETWADDLHQIYNPSVYMYYRVISDESTPGNGEIRKNQWRTERGVPYPAEMLRFKTLKNKPLMVFAKSLFTDGANAGLGGLALDALNTTEMLRLTTMMGADGLLMWDHIDTGTGPGTTEALTAWYTEYGTTLNLWMSEPSILPKYVNIPGYFP